MTQVLTGNKVVGIRNQTDAPARYFPEAVGHEKILATCKKHGVETFIKMLDGGIVSGEITQFDRWSITIKMPDGHRRTIYKHAIQYFEGKQ